jgi:hypothetical protein
MRDFASLDGIVVLLDQPLISSESPARRELSPWKKMRVANRTFKTEAGV